MKFCGMTDMLDVFEAVDLGVDFMGLIFVRSSPRSVTFELATYLRNEIGGAKAVGVFMDMSVKRINEYCKKLKLDFAQLHGKPDLQKYRRIKIPVIQAFRGVPDVKTAKKFLKVCPYILIDKADGSSVADFDAIAALPKSVRSKLFLAGGLNPKNVRDVVEKVKPFAVDCARGIEMKPGKKDSRKMRTFLNNIRSS